MSITISALFWSKLRYVGAIVCTHEKKKAAHLHDDFQFHISVGVF
jgi:hypothetical protein